MVPDTALPKAERGPIRLQWSARLSLTSRILALNLFLIVIIAGGLFYLDSYRTRLVEERRLRAEAEVVMVARGLALVPPRRQNAYLVAMAQASQSRLRLYDARGAKIADSFALAPPTYALGGGAPERLDLRAAHLLDRMFDFLVGARAIADFREPAADSAAAWPEVRAAMAGNRASIIRYAPDLTHMVSAAARTPSGSERAKEERRTVVLVTANPHEVRTYIRNERLGLAIWGLIAVIVSALLSWYLARTIVRPLRQLVRAAVRIRLGRARDIIVPRLPDRRDELGTLSRAISDMSLALRERIDATESFAADVAHELKNPLASLRSALDTLDRIDDPAVANQLLGIARDDVRRMDRLISDISEISRLDAQLARSKFEPIDLGAMVGEMVENRRSRAVASPHIHFVPPDQQAAVIMGEDVRIERAVENLIDNALSFAPPGTPVEIAVAPLDPGQVIMTVGDHGPGVPLGEREAVFRRFHSNRPVGEFGRHSGLGLAIARSVVEAHQGNIQVTDRPDGGPGAWFEVTLPRADFSGEEE